APPAAGAVVGDAAPRSAPPAPAPPPIAEVRPTSAPRPGKKEERPRPEKRQPETKIAQVVPPVNVNPNPNRPKQRFCAEIGRTAYIQAVTKEVAPGFKDSALMASDPEAALKRIQISVLPEDPVEGRDFTLVAKFVNGSDNPFRLGRVEESSPAVRGGFQPLTGVPINTVDGGASIEIFRRTT